MPVLTTGLPVIITLIGTFNAGNEPIGLVGTWIDGNTVVARGYITRKLRGIAWGRPILAITRNRVCLWRYGTSPSIAAPCRWVLQCEDHIDIDGIALTYTVVFSAKVVNGSARRWVKACLDACPVDEKPAPGNPHTLHILHTYRVE